MNDPQNELYTIGHGSRSNEAFLALLEHYHIRLLADVRTYPYSRFHPQFNRKNLEAFLPSHHIRYVFMGDTLGGRPADPSCYTNDRVDYSKIRASGFFNRGLNALKQLVAENERVAIMCSESKASECHRTRLISEALQHDFRILHIDKDGKLRPHEVVMSEIKKPDLFS